MRLVRVELSRFFSRRAVVLMILAAAALTALVAATTIWDSRPVSAEDMARAKAQVQQVLTQPEYKRELALCQDNPEDYFGPGGTSSDCVDSLAPQVQNYLNRGVLSLGEERNDSGLAVIVIVTTLMIVAGTTFAGADWGSGSMSNQLLFEPRRLRVWSAKALAAFAGCAVVCAVLVAGFWLALSLVARSRGIETGATVQGLIRWEAARGVLLAGVAGLGGYALTMLVRHTVGTLAVLFVYAAGGEALLALLPIDRASRFSPSSNVFAWVRDGVQVFDPNVQCIAPTGGCDQTFVLTLGHGAVYLVVLLALVAAVSVLSFRRRDIP
jgi:hypothetical protein